MAQDERRHKCGYLRLHKTKAGATTRNFWYKVVDLHTQKLTLYLYPLHIDLKFNVELEGARGMATPKSIKGEIDSSRTGHDYQITLDYWYTRVDFCWKQLYSLVSKNRISVLQTLY